MPGCRNGGGRAARRSRPAARSPRDRRAGPGSSEELLEAWVVAKRVEGGVLAEGRCGLSLGVALFGAAQGLEGGVGIAAERLEAGGVVVGGPVVGSLRDQ